MSVNRLSGAALGVILLGVASCTDAVSVDPVEDMQPDLQFALLDGSTTGTEDFFFLPPIAPRAPNLVGQFNPYLAPSVRICELDGGPVPSSSCRRTVDEYAPGSIAVRDNSYFLDWDPRNLGIRSSRYYRVEVLVSDSVFGYVDLDPMGNEDDVTSSGLEAETYAFGFRPRSSSVPIEFYLSDGAFCGVEAFVTECAAAAALSGNGATITLDRTGNRLGVIIDQNALPAPFEDVLVTLERIDPDAYLLTTGQECIPGLDAIGTISGGFSAPQFGDCFRVETIPELNDPLVSESVIVICLDVASLGLSRQQLEQLRMVKFSDLRQDWTALQETGGNCPTQEASLLRVPDDGLMRLAAMGVNALANLVLPEPVEAGTIKFGGFNSSFSRFRFALPGQMIPTEGDGAVIQPSDDGIVRASLTVLDAGDELGENRQPVQGARVRFTPDPGSGTVVEEEVITDSNGLATVEWSIDRTTPGDKVLTASALGLFGGPVPDPDGAAYDLVTESVTFNATVVGPPAIMLQDPSSNIDDAVAGEPEDLSVTITDVDDNRVRGIDVTWVCSPTCSFADGTQNGDGSATTTVTTDNAGRASVQWTPFTSGSQVTLASIEYDVPDAEFTATVSPGDAIQPTYSTVPASSVVAALLENITLTVTDAFDNPREGDTVIWEIISGDGSIPLAATSTDQRGVASASWTLGTLVGENRLRVTTGEFSHDFVVHTFPDEAFSITQTGAGGAYERETSLPLSITVSDRFGNPRSGDAVAWATNSGSISGDLATSTAGEAEATWMLGSTRGDVTATAVVAGTLTATFTATIKGCEVSVDGEVGADEWTCALEDGDYFVFSANVSGGETPAEVRWQQNEGNIYFLVLVEQSSLAKQNSLRIDFDNTLDGATADDDVIGYDEDTGFFDEHLSQRCANRNQAGCSTADSSTDGDGALGNDGTYTVYELSHPLDGGDPFDISVESGDVFGFFLSLTNGNGAQGNTQVPAFRLYQDVMVR